MQFSTEYSLRCCDCNEECTTKEELKVHLMLLHMGNWTPYKCEKCPALRMTTVDTLKAHQNTCHPNWSEKTLIYYYNDEKEAQLKDLLLRSLEGQSNTSEFGPVKEEITPFGLRSTSPPCLLPSNPSCSSLEKDNRQTQNTSLTFEIESSAQPSRISPVAQQYQPAKKGFSQVRKRFVCSVCRSVFTNREQASDHECRRVSRPVTAPLGLAPKLASPAFPSRNSSGNFNLSKVKTEVHQDICETSAVEKRLPLFNFKRFPFEKEKRPKSSDLILKQTTPTSVASTPVEWRPVTRGVWKRPVVQEDSPEIDDHQDVSPAKSKALLPDVEVVPKITATMELRNKKVSSVVESTHQADTETSAESRPNVKTLVLDSEAISRLESSRPLVHGSSGFTKTKLGGLCKWWHGYQYVYNSNSRLYQFDSLATWYWRCARWSKGSGCCAILHTNSGGEGGEKLRGEHDHNPDPDALQARLAVEDMKIEALRTTEKSSRQVVDEICAKLTEAQKQRLSSDDALRRRVCRWRQKKAEEKGDQT